MAKQRMTLKKSNSNRTARTKRTLGQRKVTAKAMPSVIHLRAWLPDGRLLGVAQTNDRYIVAVFDSNERPLGTPHVFSGGAGRNMAREMASSLLGRSVRAF